MNISEAIETIYKAAHEWDDHTSNYYRRENSKLREAFRVAPLDDVLFHILTEE